MPGKLICYFFSFYQDTFYIWLILKYFFIIFYIANFTY
jgi:hypothetical protein